MRRLLSIVLGTLALSGCGLPGFQWGVTGWHEARAPNRTSITVGDIPYIADDAAVLKPINDLAGWPILVEAADPADADIVFVPITPLWTVGCYGDVLACADVATRYDGAIFRGAVYYDPRHRYAAWFGYGFLWQHELGHALGFAGDTTCVNPYRGLLSYCGFWTTRIGWFGADDAQIFADAGYR